MYYTLIFFGWLHLYLICSNRSFSEAKTTQKTQGVYFEFITEKSLLLKTTFLSLKLTSVTSDRNGCVSYCLTYSSCRSANFRISTGECSLFGVNSWENEFAIVSDCNNIILQKIAEPVVTHENWTLVFRGLGNINKSVYDAYTNTSLSHDEPLSPMYPIGCLRLDTALPCDHHFRSKVLNSWSILPITEVKFSIYKDGVMQTFLLFNGSSSTSTSWFSSANLMNSSWVDLTRSLITSFSITGFYNPPYSVRRFYVEYSNPNCNIDSGWFVALDLETDWCPWGNLLSSFPRFLYSPTNTKSNNDNMMTADVIAIFIKF